MRELILEVRAGGDDPKAVLKLGNIIMAAPDIDADVSTQRNSAERLYDGYGLLTVYVSQNDRAIGSAEWLFSSPRRIGKMKPEQVPEAERSRLKLMTNADIVDARVHTDYTGHGYFLSNPAVFSDIILILRYGRTPGAGNGRPLTPIMANYYILDDNYPQKAAPMPRGRSAAPPTG
jgi:esterase/lipase superfamily enzyme